MKTRKNHQNEEIFGEKDELRDRIESKRKELESKLYEYRANTREKGRETADEIENRLSELGEMLHTGWENVSDTVAGKLNEWLKKSSDTDKGR